MIVPEVVVLGHPAIDTLHDELAGLLAAALATPDQALAEALAGLQHHCLHHFAVEEGLMREQRFAGYQEHRHQHQQLLGELDGMRRAVARGRHGLARAWLRERLPEWFDLHVSQLDAQLVAFVRQ